MKPSIKIHSQNTGAQPTSTRSPKTNWVLEVVKAMMHLVEKFSSKTVAKVVWYFFTKPGKKRPFNAKQQDLVNGSTQWTTTYKGHKIQGYRWGPTGGPKVFLCHGWRSKTADFRRMIGELVSMGFQVEGIDMPGHGLSEGTHTAMPEFLDIVKAHCLQKGPFHAIIGYSLGGTASGMAAVELPPELKPKHLFVIASPPYIKYFFKDTIDELGYSHQTYIHLCEMVQLYYPHAVDYYNLKDKQAMLRDVKLHLIYDEDDQTVSIDRGYELWKAYPDASFVHCTGLGHYRVIADEQVIAHVARTLQAEKVHA